MESEAFSKLMTLFFWLVIFASAIFLILKSMSSNTDQEKINNYISPTLPTQETETTLENSAN